MDTKLDKSEVAGYFEKFGTDVLFIKNEYIRTSYEYKLIDVINEVKQHQGKWLDIGCGDAAVSRYSYLHHLINDIDILYYGFDLTFNRLMVGKCADSRLNLFQADGFRLPIGDQAFDFVSLIDVIEHFEDPTGVLQEVYRVLKPGGVVLITTPNKHSTVLTAHEFLRRMLAYLIHRKLAHKDCYLCAIELQELAVRAGFKVNSIKEKYINPVAITLPKLGTVGIIPPLPPQALPKLLKKLRLIEKNIPENARWRDFIAWTIFLIAAKI
jgi:ubiquinone/menaquinone biosynthesis C-methylase UbiE